MDEKKLQEMAEGVSEIRGLTKAHDKRMDRIEAILDKSSGSLVKVETGVAVVTSWREDVDKWRDTVDEKIGLMQADVQECKRSNLFTGLDKATLLKVIALLVSMLVAGNAGGEAVKDLFLFLMQLIGG